jgi:arylsulfatase A-like enzyme
LQALRRRDARRPGGLLAALFCAVVGTGCPGGEKRIVYDLARRTPVADRWSAQDVILFGTPAAEPHQAEGFYREAPAAEGDGFVWARQEAAVSLTWSQPAARAAVVELAPFRGARRQVAEVSLNGAPVGRIALNDLRHRYRITLPAAVQRRGENRLQFAFSSAAAPADADPANPDRRRLAAAFSSLVVGAEGDAALDDLLAREAPRPFAVSLVEGVPSLTQVGTSVVRHALRLPPGAELRFTPDLHPSARANGASVSFRVTLEEREGGEKELWSRVIAPGERRPSEVTLALPAAAGSIVRLGLHVGGLGRARHAWGTWTAPRVLGRDAQGLIEGEPPPAPSAAADELRRGLQGSNVVFVVLDAARARQLGCYGYARATTPEIDRIAADGVVFENAFTPAVYTLAAMSSVWTSQYPDRHHGEVSFAERLPRDRLTLADVLSAEGVHTAGFVANTVAGGLNGFDRGFREFREIWREVGSGAQVFRRVLPEWLRARRDGRFFAYVHFREPHFPYDPEPPFDTRFGPDGPIPKAARRDHTFFTDVNQGRRAWGPAEAEHLVRLYDGNLAFVDQELGALRRALEQTGLWDRTVLVIAADHGEELGEHGWIGHNVHLYDESIHIPLLVRFPSGKGPRGLRVEELVDLLDVAPTIADVFGVLGRRGSDREFQGRSLLGLVTGGGGKPAVLARTVWDRPRYALRDARYKLVYFTQTGEQWLFDLQADPGERNNLRAQDALRAAYYRQAMHEWIARLGRRPAGAQGSAPMTREQCETLKALGYIGADVRCPGG